MADVCGSGTTLAADPQRPAHIRTAFALEYLTIAWMSVEVVVAVWSGVAAHNLSLLAFGIDSVVELMSAGVLLWRLTVEVKRGRAFSEQAEKNAQRISAALLFLLAAYVVGAAVWGLWSRTGAEFSIPGLTVTLFALPIMYFLTKRKIEVAKNLGSRALRADTIESITCGYLALVVVVGLVAQFLLGAWWVDSVTSLVIVWFLLKEAREAWNGDDCYDQDQSNAT